MGERLKKETKSTWNENGNHDKQGEISNLHEMPAI